MYTIKLKQTRGASRREESQTGWGCGRRTIFSSVEPPGEAFIRYRFIHWFPFILVLQRKLEVYTRLIGVLSVATSLVVERLAFGKRTLKLMSRAFGPHALSLLTCEQMSFLSRVGFEPTQSIDY
jgi:hypothetical protein